MIPWRWTAYFRATQVEQASSTSFEQELVNDSLQVKLEKRRSLRMKLASGHDKEIGVSFFSTGRGIGNINLVVHETKTEEELERCYAWGGLATADGVDDDVLGFEMFVKPIHFNAYMTQLDASKGSKITFSASNVSGFFSEWSPDIDTHLIKVLLNQEDQKLEIVEGATVKPEKLGMIERCSLHIITKRDLAG